MIKTLVRRRRKTCFLFAIIFVFFQITGQVLKLQSSRQSTKAIKTNRSHKRKSSELYDLVYTWVNGSDPDFKTSLKTTLQQTIGYQTPRISEFQDYDQLKYSLRSVTLHCSWIRNIYIVTNGQVPVWLNTSNTMIQLVKHSEIFQERNHLPTFNSAAIEVHIHKINGLTANFLYFNDDFLLGAKITPEDFMTSTHEYKVYLAGRLPSLTKQLVPKQAKIKVKFKGEEAERERETKKDPDPIEPYTESLHHVAHIFQVYFQVEVQRQIAHIPYMLNKNIVRKLQLDFGLFFERTSSHRFRHVSDTPLAFAYFNYLQYAQDHNNPYNIKIVSGESSSVHVSLSNDDKQNGKAFETIQRKPPKFICINDNLDYRRDTQQVLTSLRYFYEEMYPDPSPFEVRQ